MAATHRQLEVGMEHARFIMLVYCKTFNTLVMFAPTVALRTERRSVRPRIKSGVNCHGCSAVLLNDEPSVATGDAQCPAARTIKLAYPA
ncbi:MAG TPA: hypothetical protein VM935_04075 [Chitinophagaceae bacterium]|nr:hypothetical protein [Chitinophagaceae bacterium]